MRNYTVFPGFDLVALCHYISHYTNTPFQEVYTKPQLSYLENYLGKNGVKAATVVCEHEYVDRNYLEDYSEYFVKCFVNYGRKAFRFHFFSKKFTEAEVDKFLNSSSKPHVDAFREMLERKYLGFIVIRPIPRTFIARSCLTPYAPPKDKTIHIITQANEANLFGVKLTVESLPFQEQDKVVAACATTSIWSYLHAPIFGLSKIPSPSAITKKSFHGSKDDNTENNIHFPTDGLNAEMMSNVLSATGLEPRSVSFQYKSLEEAKDKLQCCRYINKPKIKLGGDSIAHIALVYQFAHAYVRAGIPVILGLSVFEECEPENPLQTSNVTFKFIGRHAVTVSGYSQEKRNHRRSFSSNKYNIKMMADDIKCLYIHDDQLGPYAQAIHRQIEFKIDSTGVRHVVDYFDIPLVDNSKPKQKKRLYVPSLALVGLLPKIRIPYRHIRNTCISFNKSLAEIFDGDDQYADLFDVPRDGFVWDIQLTSVNALKKQLLTEVDFIEGRAEVLSASLPKHLWVAMAYSGEKKVFGLVFDATDIEQGPVFLQLLRFSKPFSEFAITVLRHHFSESMLKSAKESILYDSVTSILEIGNKIINDHNDIYSHLDNQFGSPKPPAYYKPGEISNDAPRIQRNATTLREPGKFVLRHEKKYIWAICREGFLHIGEDQLADDNGKGPKQYLGHPTLHKDMWARIAGELCYDTSSKLWHVNTQSGRYVRSYTGATDNHKTNAVKLLTLYLGTDAQKFV